MCLECPSAQVPWVPECPIDLSAWVPECLSARVPFEYPPSAQASSCAQELGWRSFRLVLTLIFNKKNISLKLSK